MKNHDIVICVPRINKSPLNQAGRNLMIKGTLKPSFSIHDIIAPNYVINELWKKSGRITRME